MKRPKFRWWVMFMDGREVNRFMRGLRPGFRHVLCMGWQPWAEVWCVVDWRDNKFDCGMLSKEMGWRSMEYLLTVTSKMVEFEEILGAEKRLRFTQLNCVETTKHLLGINPPGIITPYQLYQWMVKHDGIELYSGV